MYMCMKKMKKNAIFSSSSSLLGPACLLPAFLAQFTGLNNPKPADKQPKTGR